MSETPFDSQIIEMEGTETVPFKLNDKSTQEYIFENFMVDNGQEELNDLSKMPSTFAFAEQKEVYDFIAAKLNFEPIPQIEADTASSEPEEKKVGIFGRVKNRVKKVYKFFGNRILGRKNDAEEEAETEIDMDIVVNN